MLHFLSLLRAKIFQFQNMGNPNITTGDGLRLYCQLSVKGPGKISIGKNCFFSAIPGSRIKQVTLYTHSPDANIVIGNNVKMIAARISSKFSISIGNGTIIEDTSVLDTDFHTLDLSRTPPQDETLETCRIKIGDNVKIGSRSIITKGVNIGHNCSVYPGTVVQKSFPSDSQLIGNPAKILK